MYFAPTALVAAKTGELMRGDRQSVLVEIIT
jgi:hypothetical protein